MVIHISTDVFDNLCWSIKKMNDNEYVNFSQDHEMNYRLRTVGKRQTEGNRTMLRTMGKELKAATGKSRLTHGEFSPYVARNTHRLE